MLTRTSLSALRCLLYLARQEPGAVLPPKRIAEDLSESPTYLAKTARLLVKAGILRAEKGVKGGVQLSRPPAQISLLAVVEACQGAIVGNYCRPDGNPETTCAFHRAALELHEAIVGVLSHWSLAQLQERPLPARRGRTGHVSCVLTTGARSLTARG